MMPSSNMADLIKASAPGWADRIPSGPKTLSQTQAQPPPSAPPRSHKGVTTEGAGTDVIQIAVDWEGAKNEPLGKLKGLEKPYRQALTALRAGKNVVLLGPPGTGKTELAVRLCKNFSVDSDLVTATSDWSTFDTIGGYMPDPNSDGARLKFNRAAVLQAIEHSRWLIIDELNRADIDKAFGELFTVLGGEGRGVRLPYKDDHAKNLFLGTAEAEDCTVHVIPIPKDWRIIGTMNTFDKASLYQLSFAFMRRFAFVYVPVPDKLVYELIMADEWGKLHEDYLEPLKRLFAPAPNTALAQDELDLVVGPAIALDVARYLKEYSFTETPLDPADELPANAADEPPANPADKPPANPADKPPASKSINPLVERLLEAVEMFLYPQFEGREKEHPAILKAIAGALEIEEGSENWRRIDRRLAVWTGNVK